MVGDGLPGLSHRRKSVAKGLGTEFIMSQMSDRGIRKVFDQCSDEFFIAVEEELGKTLKPVRLRQSYENYFRESEPILLRKYFQNDQNIQRN